MYVLYLTFQVTLHAKVLMRCGFILRSNNVCRPIGLQGHDVHRILDGNSDEDELPPNGGY